MFMKYTASHPLSVDALCALPAGLPNVDTASTVLTGSSDGYVRAVRILPTKLLGVVADHGDWPVERISIGGGMGQLLIESEKDRGTNPSKNPKNKSKISHGKTIEAEHRQKRWWVGSVGHDDTLRMTDLEGFFREAEQVEISKGALAADNRDDDSQNEADENIGEGSQKKPEIMETERDQGEESDIPQPKKRKHRTEKDTLNAMKKRKSAIQSSFFDGL